MNDRSITKIYPTEKWMSKVPENTYIKHLRMIGTHDSAAYQINHQFEIEGHFKLLNKMSRIPLIGQMVSKIIQTLVITQNMSIKEQLNNGARFLDLRLAFDKKSNQFYLAHSFGCIDLNTVLLDIKEFIKTQQSEVIIISVKPDYQNRQSIEKNLNHFFDTVSNLMHGLLWESVGSEQIGEKTLAEVRGKAVICCGFQKNKELIHWRDTHQNYTIHSTYDVEGLKGQLNLHWENQQTAEELFQKTENQRKSAINQNPGPLLQLDASPTPRTTGVVVGILFANIVTNITNVFRNKESKKIPSMGIAHNADAIASLATIHPTFLEDDKSNQGYICTVDFLANTYSSQKMIQKMIKHSIQQVQRDEKMKTHIESTTEKIKKISLMFQKLQESGQSKEILPEKSNDEKIVIALK